MLYLYVYQYDIDYSSKINMLLPRILKKIQRYFPIRHRPQVYARCLSIERETGDRPVTRFGSVFSHGVHY